MNSWDLASVNHIFNQNVIIIFIFVNRNKSNPISSGCLFWFMHLNFLSSSVFTNVKPYNVARVSTPAVISEKMWVSRCADFVRFYINRFFGKTQCPPSDRNNLLLTKDKWKCWNEFVNLVAYFFNGYKFIVHLFW